MEKIKVLIVEDEWIVSEEIKELLLQENYHVIGQAEDGHTALQLVEEEVPDIVLMDITIKGTMDGIELADKLISMHPIAIIFLTAFYDEKFIERAKKVKPAAYIVKPFEQKNLFASIEIAFSNLEGREIKESYKVENSIFVRDETQFKKISIQSILYIEAVGSYVDIYSENEKTTLAVNLKAFEERLSSENFFRVHRSFLINSEKIDAISGNSVRINKKLIPISSERKAEFLKRYKII